MVMNSPGPWVSLRSSTTATTKETSPRLPSGWQKVSKNLSNHYNCPLSLQEESKNFPHSLSSHLVYHLILSVVSDSKRHWMVCCHLLRCRLQLQTMQKRCSSVKTVQGVIFSEKRRNRSSQLYLPYLEFLHNRCRECHMAECRQW